MQVLADALVRISIHTLRMEGDSAVGMDLPISNISIHTLRMEGDPGNFSRTESVAISIHTLRMEGDLCVKVIPSRIVQFQSTPSAWRVTLKSSFQRCLMAISIHTLRMEGDGRSGNACRGELRISIHTLRMEGDIGFDNEFRKVEISIHTLRVEGDASGLPIAWAMALFQSTPSAWRVTRVVSL